MRRLRPQKLSPERRREISERADHLRWKEFIEITDVDKINYIECRLLKIIDDERTKEEIAVKAAIAVLGWEKHRLNLIAAGLAEKPAFYTALPTPRNAPPPPEIDVTTLTNDQLRELAKGVSRGPGQGV